MKPAVMTKACLLVAIASCLFALTKENPTFLLFAENSNLWHVELGDNATASTSSIIPISSRPLALDYNFLDEKVYWIDVWKATISRAFLNGSNQETIVSSGLSYSYGLAVDSFAQNIYWTDYYEDVIEVASMDGLYRRVLISDDLRYPTDIVLDVTRGFMYWTHSSYWSQKPRIERADMDGSNRRIAIQLGCYGDAYPSALALDVTKNWLYWVDWSHDKLEVYEFPSKTRREIIPSHAEQFLSNPTGLALLENNLFWTDSSWSGIYRVDRGTGKNAKKVLSTPNYPLSIHAYEKNKTIIPVTDQCNNNNGGCSNLCLLTPFGRKCSCSEGFVLRDDGKTCHTPTQFLLFADALKRKIMKVPPQDSESLTSLPLSNSLSRPVALAYDFVEDKVYWTDIWRSTISRSFLNGSSQEVIVDELDWPYGLAVDVIGRNLYWTDTYKLEISKLNGSYQKALITTGLYRPRDIILDIKKGIMYWTNWESNPKIEKAEMTGKNRVVIVSSGLQQPNGLTLDPDKNRLYWVDGSYNTLGYLDLNQNNRMTLISSYLVLPSPFGLTLLGDNLYWTDTQQNAVYRANKDNGGNITKFVTGTGEPMDIHGYNLSEYSIPGNFPCQLNNGGCSHICLLSSTGSECACPGHLALREDGKTCYYKYDFQKFLLFADGYYSQSEIFLLPLDGSKTKAISLPIELSMSRPAALGLDIVENRIYWTDIYLNTISRVFINGSSAEIIVSDNVDNSYGLAVDPLGRNIYWTDTYSNKIEVSRMDGTMRRTLIDQDVDEPRDIILDINKGLMYWCEVGSGRKIEVANMDGDQRQILIRRGLYYPNGLTLDDTNNRLYWVDSFFDTLEYYDFERRTITTLLDSNSILLYPFGLTSLDGQLYWTDWYRDALFQANQTKPSNATVLVSGLRTPMDIHAYDRNRTLPVHNCSSSYGGCSHLCLLRPNGGYRCACPDGYSLSDDGKTCNNYTNDLNLQKFILFADGYYSQAGIFLFPLDNSSSRPKPIPISFTMRWPVALGLDIIENRIYWTDTGLNTISRVFINGSSPEVIVSANVDNSYGLAVDPLGRNIYWTDTYANKIEVSRLDGTMRKTLIDQELDDPRDIILDLRKGLMYWCEVGSRHKIEVANMDGDKRRILVRRGLYYPNGLTLDDTNNRLYWVDSYFDTLEYYDLERHVITTLVDSSSILPYPFGLTSLDDQLYWTDLNRGAVYQADKEAPSSPKVLVSGLTRPMDIHAYDRNETLPDHPCSSSYGGCSHLCLLRSDGYRCSCPDYLQFGEVCSSSVILPFSSTPVNTVSNSNYQTKSIDVIPSATSVLGSSSDTSHIKTPVLKKPSSTSLKTSVISYPLLSTIHNTPTQSKQHTVISTCKPPTPAGTTACHPKSCKNGGTCVIPGNYCKCQTNFSWHDCSVDVGNTTVEIELAVLEKNQWNSLDFKIAIAIACTELFCTTGECTSKSKSGRAKRSERASHFQPSDIVILGLSSGGGNIWKVKFAILFPIVDGPAPQPMLPDEIIQMANKKKGTIENAVGGTIKGITAASKVETKNQQKNGEHQQPLTEDKGMSLSIWIAAAVGGLVVLLIILMAFGIYRIRRKRRPHKRKADNTRLGNTHMNTEFDNPAYDEDFVYDSISKARAGSVAAGLAGTNDVGLQELRFQNDTRNQTRNEPSFDDRTYQGLDETAMTRPLYTTAQHKTCSAGRVIDNPDQSYASLQTKKERGGKQYTGRAGKIEDPEQRYAALQQKKGHPRRGGEAGPGMLRNEVPQHTFGSATCDNIYENLQRQEESGA